MGEAFKGIRHKIENCLHCNQCSSKCPYGLNMPKLLEENYKEYWEILEESKRS